MLIILFINSYLKRLFILGLIGEAQILQFNSFLEKFCKAVLIHEEKFTNYHNITSQSILIDVNILIISPFSKYFATYFCHDYG